MCTSTYSIIYNLSASLSDKIQYLGAYNRTNSSTAMKQQDIKKKSLISKDYCCSLLNGDLGTDFRITWMACNRWLGANPGYESVGLEWDLLISIVKNFPNDTDIAGLKTRLWEPLS